MDLNSIWFWLIGILLTGYSILDGYDFGVGILSLFSKNEKEKRIHFNAIGPVWDGNEVWLVTAGGALFAAFPVVYATILSGFYLAIILLLVTLIFRAVSFEFRSKVESSIWKRAWDLAFGFGSLFSAFLLGVAFGNILVGVPIDSNGNCKNSFSDLFNPYAIGIGILTVILFTMHGAIYLIRKTDGDLNKRLQKWSTNIWVIFVSLFIIMTLWSWVKLPYLFEVSTKNFFFYIFLAILVTNISILPILLNASKYKQAFYSSSLIISSTLFQTFLSLYPKIIPSSINLDFSLTIYNASSSILTLKTMLIIALVGMPIVIGYTIYIHRVFSGKVEINEDSY